MNILTDRLPDSVVIGSKEYSINSDYRIGIRFEQLMLDESVSPEEKLYRAKHLYFGINAPPSRFDDETTRIIIWFYSCGKDEDKEIDKSHERVYDFEYDSKWIYAAFKKQYNIELMSELKMHWWTFKALFDALSEDTEFVKIMGYRAVKISRKMTASQEQFYRKMKRLHKLPSSNAKDKRINDIEQALLRGDSLQNLM